MADDQNTRRLIVIFAIVTVLILIILVVLALLRAKTGASSLRQTTGCSNVPAPSGLIAVTSQTTKIKVTWNAVPEADSYKVYVGTVPGFTKSNSFADYNARTNEYTISDLTLGRTYYIFVESVSICGNSSTTVSSTVSTVLNFPAKFRIVSRANPNLALTIAPDFQNIIVQNLCSGVGLDNLCIWRYEQNTGYIVSESSLTTCLKSYPAYADVRLKYETCSTQSQANYTAARQWIYTPSEGTLCNPQNQEGLICAGINGNAVAGQNTITQSYDGTILMQWDIVEFV